MEMIPWKFYMKTFTHPPGIDDESRRKKSQLFILPPYVVTHFLQDKAEPMEEDMNRGMFLSTAALILKKKIFGVRRRKPGRVAQK